MNHYVSRAMNTSTDFVALATLYLLRIDSIFLFFTILCHFSTNQMEYYCSIISTISSLVIILRNETSYRACLEYIEISYPRSWFANCTMLQNNFHFIKNNRLYTLSKSIAITKFIAQGAATCKYKVYKVYKSLDQYYIYLIIYNQLVTRPTGGSPDHLIIYNDRSK